MQVPQSYQPFRARIQCCMAPRCQRTVLLFNNRMSNLDVNVYLALLSSCLSLSKRLSSLTTQGLHILFSAALNAPCSSWNVWGPNPCRCFDVSLERSLSYEENHWHALQVSGDRVNWQMQFLISYALITTSAFLIVKYKSINIAQFQTDCHLQHPTASGENSHCIQLCTIHSQPCRFLRLMNTLILEKYRNPMTVVNVGYL